MESRRPAEARQGALLGRRQRREVGEPASPGLVRLAACLVQGVVGQVGGQRLGPVAAVVVDAHPGAPPGMHQLVGQRGVGDEGQRDDPLAEQGEAGEGEPHRLGEGGQGEAVERVGAEALLEHRQVARRVRQVGVGETCVEGGGKEGAQPSAVGLALPCLPGADGDLDVAGVGVGVARGHAFAARALLDQRAGAHRALAVGQVERQRERARPRPPLRGSRLRWRRAVGDRVGQEQEGSRAERGARGLAEGR